VDGINIEEGKVTSVRIKGEDPILADQVIMCLGPWSGDYESILSKLYNSMKHFV
jgi:glycine/D-amino acid oxidase-like deaminating enzyme